jgi:hypothetical protein
LEYSWSVDVVRYGLGKLGITRCSRFPGTNSILTNEPQGPGSNLCSIWILPSNPSTDNYGHGSAVIPPGSHFPYGFTVEPNVPV